MAALVGCAGCSGTGSVRPVAVSAFPGSASSLESLGQQVLTGLTTGDALALAGARLTKQEHNGVLWPELPASDPALNVPLDYAWNDIQRRDAAALDRVAEWYVGRDAIVRSVRCDGVPRRFATFSVLTDCWVVFDVGGVEPRDRYRAQLFKDVVERGGGYKIFRYYDELPQPFDG